MTAWITILFIRTDNTISTNPNVILGEKAILLFCSILAFFFSAWLLYLLGLNSHDLEQYKIHWEFTRDTHFLNAYSQQRHELGSYILFWTLTQWFSAGMTFYLFGLIALSGKFYIFMKYSNYPLIAFFAYAATFVHFLDANQIRAALASTTLLYALFTPNSGRYAYVLLAIIGTLFHYSGVLILIFYLVRFPLTGLFLVAFFGFIFDWLVISVDYLAFARRWLPKNGQVNLTSSLFIMQVFISIVCALFWRRLSYTQKKGAYLNAFGLVTYIVFSDNAQIAHRIRELSQLGVLAILFLGEKRLTYVKFFSAIFFGYIVLYNINYVIGRLF